MFWFITNCLEPVACFFYLVAMLVNYSQKRQIALFPLLALYLTATVLLSVATFWAGKSSNIWIYDVVALLTSVCLGLYFYQILQAPLKKYTVLGLMLLSLVYSAVRNFTMEEPRLFDSIGYSLTSASVVVYVFMYFYQVLKNVTEVNILREFNFWLASGYLLYYAGCFVIFVTYYYLTKRLYEANVPMTDPGLRADRHLLTALWGLHNVLFFVGAITLLISSLWVNYRRRSTSLSSRPLSLS